jgi:diguanylate cyclase (GGDEF)-like protein
MKIRISQGRRVADKAAYLQHGGDVATILLIEDSESHRTRIQDAVERSGLFSRVLEARDGLEAERVLQTEGADIVLCDLETPRVSGEKLLQIAEPRAGRGQISFLFLTAPGNLSRALSVFDDETCDVVSKPFDAADLIARLRLQMRIKRLRDEVLEKRQQLEKESTVDTVTGLRSRSFMQEALRVEILRAQRHRIPLSVLMADLDHFRRVNERWGKAAGDAVLQHTASFVRRNLRSTDLAGRFGGEEFLVILPHTPIAGGVAVAEFWREMVAKSPVQVGEGERIEVTISLGVADLRPPMKTWEELVKAANEALSAAKAKGRNCVVAYR